MQKKGKKRIEEISFVLQNIFIVHPNPNSKYKIRIIVNRNNSDNSFRKVSNRYTFKLASNAAQLKEKACYLVLLQKAKKEGSNGQYLEIGKAEIDLSGIIEDQEIKNESVVNGVVYGTRSYNFDRIIGKYSYKVFKPQTSSSPTRQVNPQKIGKPILGGIKRKEKPAFPFQQSIMQQERDLQSKIKELTHNMNKIMSAKEIEEPYEGQHLTSAGLMPIKESFLDQSQYYYKYNEKFNQQLNSSQANPKELSTLTIKNIRVDSRSDKSQEKDKMMLETIKVENPKINPKKNSGSKKMEEVLLVFYELFEERRVRKRLLEIYLPIYLNKDNRNLVHQIFYLPKTANKILFQLSFVTDSFNKYKNLNGVINSSVAKSRLVELFDLDNQQKGIMVCQLENCIQIDQQEAKAYKKQSPNFDKAMRRHGNLSQFVKKPRVVEMKEEVAPKQAKTLDNSAKDTLYSNFHSSKEVKNIKRNRYKTSLDQSSGKLELITPSISRFNRSEVTSKHNLSLSSKNSTRFFSKSIRAFPTMTQSVVKKGEADYSNKGAKYRLYIESGQFNIYEMNENGTKLLLKLFINSKSDNKRVTLGEADWLPLHIEFRQLFLNDCLGVQLLANKRNTTLYKKVGNCSIVLSELQNAKHKYKAYLSHDGKVIGYIIFKFKLFRREADQKSQSFYYQQGFQRHSLIRSERSEDQNRNQTEHFENLQAVAFKTDSERSFNKDGQQQFQLSFESKQIEPANSSKLHYISQKVSDGKLSEVLENEDYQNGESIPRRF